MMELEGALVSPSSRPLNASARGSGDTSLCLAPLRFIDSSDASESGGGFVMAKRLTKLRSQAESSRRNCGSF